MPYLMTARTVLKWLFCEAMHRLGAMSLLEFLQGRTVRILSYHRVRPTRVDDGLSISLKVFEAQLQYLAGHYEMISLDEVVERVAGRRPIRKAGIALTFDDGYRDNYQFAFPSLMRNRIPATIFLATGPIDRQESLWPEVLKAVLWKTEQPSLDLGFLGWGEWALGCKEERQACLGELKQRLKAVHDETRRDMLTAIAGQLGQPGEPRGSAEMLTWTMVREMHKAGIGFGAHTVNHGILTRMSLKDAQREIVDSKARLDSEFNEPARHFAYPNGTGADWNPQIQSLVCQAGFRSACTTVPGLNRSGDDLYALRRLEVNDAGCTDPFGRFSPAMFRAHMVGLVGW